MATLLNIVESAYRATLEEQDDTIVWISHALRGAGAEVDLLLRGPAVNYAVAAQKVGALQFGDWKQTHPPDLDGNLTSFLNKGGKVLVLQDDLSKRGIEHDELIAGITPVDAAGLGHLIASYDRVWAW